VKNIAFVIEKIALCFEVPRFELVNHY